MGEFELISRYFREQAATPAHDAVVLGIGDDCALMRPPLPGQLLAISADMLIEGRHFFAGTDPAAVGHKSLAVNLSDLAAMGAEPAGFTLSLALPAIDEKWLQGFRSGLFALAERFACPLVGGDTTRGPLAVAITVFGQVPDGQALRRDGARAGDELWVSGPLGGASFAVAARRLGAREVDEGATRRLDWPEPRVALGLQLRGIAHAAIDLSDGLAGDLRHVLAASSGSPIAQPGACGAASPADRRAAAPGDRGTSAPGDDEAAPPADRGSSPGLRRASSSALRHELVAHRRLVGASAWSSSGLMAELFAADIPLDPCLGDLPAQEAINHAIDGGDDYELLFSAAPEDHQRIRSLWPTAGMIGRLRAGSGILLTARDGSSQLVEQCGFDHFAQ